MDFTNIRAGIPAAFGHLIIFLSALTLNNFRTTNSKGDDCWLKESNLATLSYEPTVTKTPLSKYQNFLGSTKHSLSCLPHP